jgi:hypothetical protein
MQRPPPGQYRSVATAGEAFQAFVPAPLPPVPPDLPAFFGRRIS